VPRPRPGWPQKGTRSSECRRAIWLRRWAGEIPITKHLRQSGDEFSLSNDSANSP
jgi:hypothetical protein